MFNKQNKQNKPKNKSEITPKTTPKTTRNKPNLPQTVLAVAACKFTRRALRLLGRGGTALPGRAARLVAKDILLRTSDGMEIIVVTGTNGKTTTCRMIEHALIQSGRTVLANKSGANLLSGVTAEITCNAAWNGRPKADCAVIECDEGALKQVVPLIHPKIIVVTNLFRDQLDRYGEITHTVNAVREGIRSAQSAGTVLCLNADDSLVASLAQDAPGRVVWYGMDTPAGDQKEPAVSDAKYCIRCGAPYEYHYRTYAHLGGFYCPSCGYARPDADLAVTEIDRISAEGTQVHIRAGGALHEASIALPAVYNVYNAVAAVCALTAFGLPVRQALDSLSDVRSGFGRMETFRLGETRVQMILVKNPAGCSQALSYIASAGEDFNLVFCLNDRTADGHDISWIWDAEYELLSENPHVRQVIVSGDRAEDMQLRLKYAGFPKERIALEKDNANLLSLIRRGSLPVFILPNYTSMLALRRVLSEATGGKAFWEG